MVGVRTTGVLVPLAGVCLALDLARTSWKSREHQKHFCRRVGHVQFPRPRGLKTEALQFRIKDKTSLPQEFWPYWPMISACVRSKNVEDDELAVLSIWEGNVRQGEVSGSSGLTSTRNNSAPNSSATTFVACNLNRALRIWDVRVKDLGSEQFESLRPKLPPTRAMPVKANDLWVMSADCLFEKLPISRPSQQQWFQLTRLRPSKNADGR
mmetsp:Transcript_9801/g.20910  ORF Transcript_9801/g.20910 Transcript_9801/m.20910 type:complete len:210 (-) Transcript_9801:53-682(-)